MAKNETPQGAASNPVNVVETAFDSIAARAFAVAMQNAVHIQQEAAVFRAAALEQIIASILALPLGDTKVASAGKAYDAGLGGDLAENVATSDALAAVDPQVVDAVNAIREATAAQLSPARNNAQQFVALSAALVVQDAASAWRAMSTLSEVIAGVAVGKFLASGDEKPLLGVTAARDLMKAAAEEFAEISHAAAKTLKDFS